MRRAVQRRTLFDSPREGRVAGGAGREDAAALARDHLRGDVSEEPLQVAGLGALRTEARRENRRAGEHDVAETVRPAVDGRADDEPDRAE